MWSGRSNLRFAFGQQQFKHCNKLKSPLTFNVYNFTLISIWKKRCCSSFLRSSTFCWCHGDFCRSSLQKKVCDFWLYAMNFTRVIQLDNSKLIMQKNSFLRNLRNLEVPIIRGRTEQRYTCNSAFYAEINDLYTLHGSEVLNNFKITWNR